LKGKRPEKPLREATVHNTFKDVWGLRKGKWLYINKPSGEHSKMPASFKKIRGYEDFETEGLLFDLKKDPEQRINLFAEHPERAQDMADVLERYRSQGFSVK